MRKLIVTLTVIALIAAVGAVTALGATSSVAWKSPSIKTVKIKKNSSVKWVWSDSKKHNLRGPGLSGTKFVKKRGYTVTRKFTRKGTFRYVCDLHANMKTTVKVL
jgi:plastocyanin